MPPSRITPVGSMLCMQIHLPSFSDNKNQREFVLSRSANMSPVIKHSTSRSCCRHTICIFNPWATAYINHFPQNWIERVTLPHRVHLIIALGQRSLTDMSCKSGGKKGGHPSTFWWLSFLGLHKINKSDPVGTVKTRTRHEISSAIFQWRTVTLLNFRKCIASRAALKNISFYKKKNPYLTFGITCTLWEKGSS